MKGIVSVFRWLSVSVVMSVVLSAQSPELVEARKRFDRTDYEGVLQALNKASRGDAAAWELHGRAHLHLGDFKRATEAFEKAVQLEPGNSEYALWLGRAFGRRAETSTPFTAPGYASKARRNFERAVELNPRNLEAMNDLFEYYLEAPGFLGGGLDKAKAMAERISRMDAAEGHYVLAKIAEKHKEFDAAEEQFRRAVDAAPRQVGRFIDLARFLAKQGKVQESELTFAKAEKVAPASPKLLYARAETYVKGRRNLDTARTLLKQYLNAPITPDDPSKADAEKLLREAGS